MANKRKVVAVMIAALMVISSLALVDIDLGKDGNDRNNSTYLESSNIWDGSADTGFAGGTGTDAYPYQIATPEQLAYLAELVNGGSAAFNNPDVFYQLIDDIILNDLTHATVWGNGFIPKNSWTPIGTNGNPFQANFDGRYTGVDHVVKGIYINSDDPYQGLFGYATGNISNTGTEQGYIQGQDWVGGVAGSAVNIINCHNSCMVISQGGRLSAGGVAGNASGSITNCYNTGDVSSDGSGVGGIVGETSGSVTDCYNTGTITGAGDQIGGVAGYAYGAGVNNCYNTGNVVSTGAGENTGGVVGYISDADITNCYNTGTVTGSGGENVGGVAGASGNGTIINCYNTGAVTCTGSYIGGIAGNLQGTSDNCYNTGTVTGGAFTGALIGTIMAGTVDRSYSLSGASANLIGGGGGYVTPSVLTFDASGVIAGDVWFSYTGLTAPSLLDALNGWVLTDDSGDYKFWKGPPFPSFSNAWNGNVAASFAAGTGIATDPYMIANASQLAYLARIVNNGTAGDSSVYYALANNIYLNDTTDWTTWGTTYPANGWTPIGDTDSTPFAANFNGSGFNVMGVFILGGETAGLFGHSTGTISNVGLQESYIRGGGGIVGFNSGVVNRCMNSGDIGGAMPTPGMGSNTISGCIVGTNDTLGIVKDCWNEGTLSQPPSRVPSVGIPDDGAGGIVGTNYGYVTGCWNAGAVVTNCVGGIALINYGYVTGCWNEGTFSGSNIWGGIVYANNGYVTGCWNEGSIVSNPTPDVPGSPGGVVQINNAGGIVADCYNTGLVSNQGFSSGGVVYSNSGLVINSYNTGNVVGTNNTGGVVGNNLSGGTVTNCYNWGYVGTTPGTAGGAATQAGVIGNNQGSTDYIYSLTGTNSNMWGSGSTGTVGANASFYSSLGTLIVSSITFPSGAVLSGSIQLVDALNGWVNDVSSSQEYMTWDDATDPTAPVHAAGLLWDGTAALWFAGGTGTDADPYLIANAAQLRLLMTLINTPSTATVPVGKPDPTETSNPYNDYSVYYALTGNISLNDTTDWDTTWGATIPTGVNVWEPIGTSSYPFRSNFDGNGFAIEGMYISSGGASNIERQGLFGTVIGTVSNTGVEKSYVRGFQYNGALVGYLDRGTVAGCWNSGTVTGGGSGTIEYNAGVVGYMAGGTVTGCWNTANLSGLGNQAAGVVGYMTAGTITGCWNIGDIYGPGNLNVGGVAGGYTGTIMNSWNTGTITGGQQTGGVVGCGRGITIINCWNTGDVKGSGGTTGGLGGVVGAVVGSGNTITGCWNEGAVSTLTTTYINIGGILGTIANSATVTDCWNAGAVTGNDNVGGIVGNVPAGNTISNCWNSGAITGIRNIGGVAGNMTGSTIDGCQNYGAIKKNDVALTSPVGTGGIVGYMAANGIVMNSQNYGPIVGTGNTAFVNSTGGVAGYVTTGTVMNSQNYGAVAGMTASPPGGAVDTYATGGIVGHMLNGRITDCWNTGPVSNIRNIVGGVAGKVEASIVTDCWNSGSISGVQRTAGVVGHLHGGTITGCWNSGTVSGSQRVGGVVGIIDGAGSVADCYNLGTVNVVNNSGGVVGVHEGASIVNSYNAGNVTGTGGNVGGLIGNANSTTLVIVNCYNTGTISTNYSQVGGLIGAMVGATLFNGYNAGMVIGNDDGAAGSTGIGGVVGHFVTGSTMYNCYNTGDVTSNGTTTNMGGVIGWVDNSSTVDYSYSLEGSAPAPIGGMGVANIGDYVFEFDANGVLDGTVEISGFPNTTDALMALDNYVMYKNATDPYGLFSFINGIENRGIMYAFGIPSYFDIVPDDAYDGTIHISIYGTESVFSSTIKVMEGTPVSFRAVGDTNFVFSVWTGLDTSKNPTDIIFVTDDMLVGAVFLDESALTLQTIEYMGVTGDGYIRVTLDGGTPFIFDDDVTVEDGTEVSFEAFGNGTYVFSRWTGGSILTTGASSDTETITGTMNVGAVFVDETATTTHIITFGGITGTGTITITIDGLTYPFVDDVAVSQTDTVSFTATGSGTFVFSRWTGGAILITSASSGTVTVTEPIEVGAVFVDITSPATHTITYGGITGSGTGTMAITINGTVYAFTDDVAVSNSDVISFTATAGGTSVFSLWTGGAILTTSPSSGTVTVTTDITVGATFLDSSAGIRTITFGGVTGTGMITITVNGAAYHFIADATVSSSDTVSFLASPSGTYAFSAWTGGAITATSASSGIITVPGDITVGAVFLDTTAPTTHTITFGGVTGTGTGTIAITMNGVTYPFVANMIVSESDTVSFTATAGVASAFSAWTGGAITATGTSTGIVPVTGNITVGAEFIDTTGTTSYTITFGGIIGSGTITITVNGTPSPFTADVTVNDTDEVSFAASPSGTYAFSAWTGGSITTTSVSSGTVTVTDMTVGAVFLDTALATTHTIIFDGMIGSGTITMMLNGIGYEFVSDVAVSESDTVSFTASPSGTYAFSVWTGGDITTVSAFTGIIPITGDMTVGAVFLDTALSTTHVITYGGVIGTGTITVTINGIGYSFTQSVVVSGSDTISFNATAAGTYEFARWTGGSITAMSASPGTVAVTGPMTVGAVFLDTAAPITHVVTYGGVTGSGTIAIVINGVAYPFASDTLVSQTDTVSFTATASGTYAFSVWTGGAIFTTSASSGAMTITEPITVGALFLDTTLPTTYMITYGGITGSGTIAITINGVTYAFTSSIAVSGSDTVSFEATADGTFVFSVWTGGAILTTNESTGTIAVTKDITVGAVFIDEAAAYLITFGGITGSGTITVTINGVGYGFVSDIFVSSSDVISFTATPAGTYAFSSWTGGAITTTNASTGTVPITDDMTVGALFLDVAAPTTYTIKYGGITGSGTMTITINGIDYTFTSDIVVHEAHIISITAAAGAGHALHSWTGDLAGNAPIMSVTSNIDIIIGAIFVDITEPGVTSFLLTISTDGPGTVQWSADGKTYADVVGPMVVPAGATVYLNAVPDAGETFTKWTGDFTGTVAKTSLTVDSDMSVTAVFSDSSIPSSGAGLKALILVMLTLFVALGIGWLILAARDDDEEEEL